MSDTIKLSSSLMEVVTVLDSLQKSLTNAETVILLYGEKAGMGEPIEVARQLVLVRAMVRQQISQLVERETITLRGAHRTLS